MAAIKQNTLVSDICDKAEHGRRACAAAGRLAWRFGGYGARLIAAKPLLNNQSCHARAD
jgi:hypothetical protein